MATASVLAVVVGQSTAFSVVATDVLSMNPVVSAEAVVETVDVAISCVAR